MTPDGDATTLGAEAELLLCGASLPDGRTVDVGVRAGRVVSLTPASGSPSGGTHRVDLAGYLLLPAPAEPHAHLDKALTADVVANPTGDLAGAVAGWLRYRPHLREDDIVRRATATIRAYLGHGATAIRTHVDLASGLGLTALSAVLRVRAALHRECAIQVVAFAGVPLSGVAGARNRALLREAMAAGADVVGGCPALDPDPVACVDTCLTTAAGRGAPVDLHIDEDLDPASDTLDLLADAVRATGFPHPVVASHCVSLGMMPPERARMIADRVAAAHIGVICLPATNLFLQGRGRPVATPRGLTALGILRAAGVPVAAGGDNQQDPFNPTGRADPLETAALMVLAGHQPVAQAYAAVSSTARDLLGLASSTPDLPLGAPAELLAIRARSVGEAVATASPDRIVFHAGREVARTWLLRHFPAQTTHAAPPAHAAPPTHAIPPAHAAPPEEDPLL